LDEAAVPHPEIAEEIAADRYTSRRDDPLARRVWRGNRGNCRLHAKLVQRGFASERDICNELKLITSIHRITLDTIIGSPRGSVLKVEMD
jgi:hypothetical protein